MKLKALVTVFFTVISLLILPAGNAAWYQSLKFRGEIMVPPQEDLCETKPLFEDIFDPSGDANVEDREVFAETVDENLPKPCFLESEPSQEEVSGDTQEPYDAETQGENAAACDTDVKDGVINPEKSAGELDIDNEK